MILVTGGTGFLGKAILRQLKGSNKKIRVLGRTEHPEFKTEFPEVEFIKGDVNDPFMVNKALENVEYVIHNAAKVGLRKSDHQEIHKTNVLGTENMVNQSLEFPIKKFVFVSSIAALGRTENGLISEATKWNESGFYTHYGLSKYRGEMEVHRGVQEGLKACIISPSLILGMDKWESKTSASLFRMAFKEYPFYSSGSCGVVGVKDVAAAIELVMESPACEKGDKFLLCAENYSYKNLMTEVAKGFNKKPPKYSAPNFLVSFLGRIQDFKSRFMNVNSPVSYETAQLIRKNYKFDGSKISRELGFKYTPISEVITETTQAYLKKGTKP